MSRSSELALSDLTIGGDNSTGAFAPAVQVAAARGAFFRKPGVTKADVQNDDQDTQIAAVSTALVGEASTARAAELSLTTRVTGETEARVSRDLSLTTAVSAEASTARAAELVLTNAVSTEVADRTSAVSTALVSANTYTDGKIADLVNGAPGLLDTLKELSDALGGDQNFATTILGKFGDVSVALSNEVIRAGSVEIALSSALSTEVVDRSNAVNIEASIARSSELSLQVRFSTAVAAEATTSRSAELSLGTSVSAEATRAISAELSLTTRVAAENAARVSGDLSLTTALTVEASVSRSAELSLTTLASTETAARVSADLSLTTRASTETAARISGDLSLTTALTAEASVSRSAELSLTTRVSVEEVTRASTLAAAISTEVVDRNAAISTQASVTLAGAYQYTDGAISTEVINRSAAISVALASANSYTDGAVASLSSAVTNNISTVVLNTSTNLSNAISTEVSDRNSAISTSVSNLSTAVSIALAAEESTARSAELSIANLISAQTSTTVSNISAALSTNTANRITYQTAATTKFNSIQQAFDVIFDAIDIEKYQGSAPDYFQYDETVQTLAPAQNGTITSAQIVENGGSLNTNIVDSTTYTIATNGTFNVYATPIFANYDADLVLTDGNNAVISTLSNVTSGVASAALASAASAAGVVYYKLKLVVHGTSTVINEKLFSVRRELVVSANSETVTRNLQVNEVFEIYNGETPLFIVNAMNGASNYFISNTWLSDNQVSGYFNVEPSGHAFGVSYATTVTAKNAANEIMGSLVFNFKILSSVKGIADVVAPMPGAAGVKVSPIDGSVYTFGTYTSASVVTVKNLDTTSSDSSVTLPVTTTAAAYLVKYNAVGVAQWGITFDGSSTAVTAGLEIISTVEFDSDNNFYIGGRYSSFIDLYMKNYDNSNSSIYVPAMPAGTPLTAAVPFMVKYNSSGVPQWATVLTSTSPNKASTTVSSISINGNDVYAIGNCQTGAANVSVFIQIHNGTSLTTSSVTFPNSVFGVPSGFVAKYNTSGVVQWMTGIKHHWAILTDSFIDSNNNINIIGTVNTSVPLVNSAIFNASGNGQVVSSLATIPVNVRSFIIKYNSSGVAQSLIPMANPSVLNQSPNISKDSNGNFYALFQLTGNVTLYDSAYNVSSLTLPSVVSSVYRNVLVKYNSSGVPQWTTCVDNPAIGSLSDVLVGANDEVYITGAYSGAFTVKNVDGNTQADSNFSLPSTTGTGMFVIKYNPAGKAVWATYLDGAAADTGYKLSLTADQKLYVGGGISGTVMNVDGTGQISSGVTVSSNVVIRYQ
jgi:hypothetical protein